MDSVHRDELFGRLLSALLTPASGVSDVLLVGYQPPIALLELPGEPPMVLLDVAGAAPDEVARRAERIVEQLGGHRLLLVVAGGGPDYKSVLANVGAKAKLTTYHLGASGQLDRVVGPPVFLLQKLAAGVTARAPLSAADAAALLARGQKENEEANNFLAQLKGRRPWVTMVLLATCVLLHALAMIWPALWEGGANAGALVWQGQVWRLFSAAYLHAHLAHLLMNMLALWSFGGFLEPILGWRRYLVVYALSALVGSVASAIFGERPSVGASGALWGLMVAGFALMRARKTVIPARIARQMKQRLVGVLFLNVLITFAIPGIDKYGHFGGGLAGGLLMASGLLMPRALGAVGDEPWWIRALAWLLAALMALSVIAAVLAAGAYRPG